MFARSAAEISGRMRRRIFQRMDISATRSAQITKRNNREDFGMEEKGIVTVVQGNDALMEMDYDNILAVADRVDKLVPALNKIMSAALGVTTPKDWVLIGGTPYLQEAGATKVARLFGISTKICDGFPVVTHGEDGYPIYKYRMRFSMGKQSIEADGMRSAGDEFFAGKDKSKAIDQIPLDDVERAAYTNCMNNGIKRIIPGLRNLDISDLEAAGINPQSLKGYTFKQGSKGGNSGKAADSGIVCSNCGSAVTQKVASFSQSKHGRILCMKCQDLAKAGRLPADLNAEEGGHLPWDNQEES